MLGTSVALLALPPFIEWQRMEMEESMNMQKKQVCICYECRQVCVVHVREIKGEREREKKAVYISSSKC